MERTSFEEYSIVVLVGIFCVETQLLLISEFIQTLNSSHYGFHLALNCQKSQWVILKIN